LVPVRKNFLWDEELGGKRQEPAYEKRDNKKKKRKQMGSGKRKTGDHVKEAEKGEKTFPGNGKQCLLYERKKKRQKGQEQRGGPCRREKFKKGQKEHTEMQGRCTWITREVRKHNAMPQKSVAGPGRNAKKKGGGPWKLLKRKRKGKKPKKTQTGSETNQTGRGNEGADLKKANIEKGNCGGKKTGQEPT